MLTRRSFFGTLPAPLALGAVGCAESSRVFVVPEPDELAVAAEALGKALDRLESVLASYDLVVKAGREEVIRGFESDVLDDAYQKADDAEQAFLETLRARGKVGVQFRGRLYLDQSRALDAEFDRFRSRTVVVEVPTIQAL